MNFRLPCSSAPRDSRSRLCNSFLSLEWSIKFLESMRQSGSYCVVAQIEMRSAATSLGDSLHVPLACRQTPLRFFPLAWHKS
jgi:hypothetical protein